MNSPGTSSALAVGHKSQASVHGPRASGRRRWSVPLAVLTLSSALLLAPAVPALAVEGVPDFPARFSACVGPALESAGFRDMDGSFAEDAANCLAHYEITLGTDPGMFSPGQAVPRWQMALFLARAARAAGMTLPRASDQGFTDLNVGSDTRDAINQMASLRVMEGTSSTTFDPQAPVTREQMAVLLAQFLSIVPRGPGGANINMIIPDDDHFVDLAQADFQSWSAIRKIYELGVTAGTTVTTFSPLEHVNRAQMAVFISRMLAHTNVRPAGLNLQLATAGAEDSETVVLVSYRDDDRRPLGGELVDIFMSTEPDQAFDESGRCTGNVTPVVGTRSCVVDSSDRITGSSGNVLADLEVGDVYALRVWAWTGRNGEVYDDDSGRATVLDVKTPSSVIVLEVSDNMPPTARKLRFGVAVTFTFRLVDGDGDPVRRPGVEFTIDVERSRNGRTLGRATIAKETGPDGSAEIMVRHADPSEESGDIAQLDLDIRSSSDLRVDDRTIVGLVNDDGNTKDVLLDWADDPAEPTAIRLSLSSEYRVASSRGVGVGNTVRARLSDQYGSGVVGEAITLTSGDGAVAPRGADRTTNMGGVATFYYRRDSGSSATELITARFGNFVATARQYWAARVPEGTSGSGEVRVVDLDNNAAIVVSGNDVWLIEYEAYDRFRIGHEVVAIPAFEHELTVGDTLAFEIADSSESAVNSYTLTNR